MLDNRADENCINESTEQNNNKNQIISHTNSDQNSISIYKKATKSHLATIPGFSVHNETQDATNLAIKYLFKNASKNFVIRHRAIRNSSSSLKNKYNSPYSGEKVAEKSLWLWRRLLKNMNKLILPSN